MSSCEKAITAHCGKDFAGGYCEWPDRISFCVMGGFSWTWLQELAEITGSTSINISEAYIRKEGCDTCGHGREVVQEVTVYKKEKKHA